MRKLDRKNIRVVVAMSGGVDSSVAAALLKRQGSCAEPGRSIDVVGIFMKFWSDQSASRIVTDKKDNTNRCCSLESEKLARLVAKKIGIPFYVLNVEKEFKKKVVDYFLEEYKKGNTPNPCVVCNKEIKFGFLIKKALELGADFVATGHYTRISVIPSLTGNPGKVENTLDSRFRGNDKRQFKLLKGKDKNKDQSYFLWQLSQEQLSHVLFPVGGYIKPEVRKLARKFNLPTAETPESQEVCFVSDSVNNFLKKYLKPSPGEIKNADGEILGQHNGLWFYTIGQRRGLEIAQGPWYVVGKDFKKNALIISKNKKNLLKKELIVKNVNWVSDEYAEFCGRRKKSILDVEVKIRYKSNFAKAKIFSVGKNKVKVVFQKPQQAITPGQSAVFYKGKELLGGGVIIADD
ncbi:MAG: tRNA 2-thiouridine(34) synthase MnmA [Candidatus Staskawiczbacteria bacterium]|nr:tRNA 2-thiouridine(34) synthase MnmA [Candidatus Staskawiczbacteria bacterium]